MKALDHRSKPDAVKHSSLRPMQSMQPIRSMQSGVVWPQWRGSGTPGPGRQTEKPPSGARPRGPDFGSISIVPPSGPLLQRKCDCGGKSDEMCETCQLSRKAEGTAGGPARVPSVVGEVLRSSGRSLDAAAQGDMGARFGFDFSRVRIHDDAQAAESAASVAARAYTVGNNVVFGRGQYAPSTDRGRRLLAHELTHVVQQHRSSTATMQPFSIGPAHGPAEREADAVADAVVAGSPLWPIAQTPGTALQRARLTDTSTRERFLDLGSAEVLACCDSNACVDDAHGFDCKDFDCKASGDKTAKNNALEKPGHKFSPHLKCDPPCGKNFTASYTGSERIVALPSGRRKGKDKCGQTLAICHGGKSVEVTIGEYSNHNVWETSPGVAKALDTEPDFQGSIYPSMSDPDMKDDSNCTPKSKPAKPAPPSSKSK
jgi:Domain of unknown function (DUF4157)